MDANRGPQVLYTTALPTEPQPLPQNYRRVNICLLFLYWLLCFSVCDGAHYLRAPFTYIINTFLLLFQPKNIWGRFTESQSM